MSHYVVTGGAGFIGSALVRALVGSGKSVHVIDNLSTGKLENLEEIAGQITFHQPFGIIPFAAMLDGLRSYVC